MEVEENNELMLNGRNNLGQFVSGRKETEEEKLKRGEALKEAWKNRDDYIGDIRHLHPYIYNSWRSIKFTEKGKKAGNSKEWDDFRTFYNDVVDSYKEGLVFRRKDVTKPFSKDNFMWIDKSSIGDLRCSVFLEYNGKRYSLRQWAEETGVPYYSIKNRYCKKKDIYTTEEIIFGKKRKRGSKVAQDYKESNTPIREKASKMISTYKLNDKKMGFEKICDIDIDWMINNIITQKCIYCGDERRVGCDRIDNNKGHTKDNVVPCCYDCNCARNNNFSYEEMKVLGKTIREIKNNRLISE